MAVSAVNAAPGESSGTLSHLFEVLNRFLSSDNESRKSQGSLVSDET
jgi:hypothetical protein